MSDMVQVGPKTVSKRLTVPDMVCVKATDFNGRNFDGFPFSDRPEWLRDAIKRRDIVIATEVVDRDYAVWDVVTLQGVVRALPGDHIAWWGDCLTVVARPEKDPDWGRRVPRCVDIESLSGAAKDVAMQLFVSGPTWDGDLAAKSGRDELVALGLAFRVEGWQSLTVDGVAFAMTADVSKWADKRWYRKQQNL